MKNYSLKLKILTIFFFILLSLFLCNSSKATKWYEYDNEDGVVGNQLPASMSGPYFGDFASTPPDVYAQDAIRGKFASLTTIVPYWERGNLIGGDHALNIENPNGTYGTAFSYANPITLVSGTTYYLGGFFRFERVGGNDIWTDIIGGGDNRYWDFDKLIELRGPGNLGTGFRWLVDSGGVYMNYVAHKFSFNLGCTATAFAGCIGDCGQNQNGYTQGDPYLCDYEKWYSLVVGITYHVSGGGRARMWINGTLVTDVQDITTGATGATLNLIHMNGTIGQPKYNASAHKRQFDRIILTNSWQDIINGGYLQDPNQGNDTTPPAAPTGLTVS